MEGIICSERVRMPNMKRLEAKLTILFKKIFIIFLRNFFQAAASLVQDI
jgi:hypothetical protein